MSKSTKFFKGKLLIGFTLLLLGYLIFWPVPVEPNVWQPPIDEGYVGDFQVNEKLENFQALTMGDFTGPEAAIILDNGNIITATHEGWLMRLVKGTDKFEAWVEVKGRPLGLALDAQGNVWVANAYLGLQKVSPEGSVSLELNKVENAEGKDTAIQYADDLAVAPNGKIYFSDATMRFPAAKWGGTFPASVLDIVEHGDTGRIIEFDPISKSASVIFKGLNFANGVAADPNGRFILVNETGEYRIWKHWIAGAKAGQSEVLIDNLPGFPDNISLGMSDIFWVGLMAPRSVEIDQVAAKPFLRKMLIRLPEFLKPKAKNYGMVIGIDADGKVLHNMQAPSGKLYATTGLVETESFIYVTSLTTPFLAKIKKADAGL